MSLDYLGRSGGRQGRGPALYCAGVRLLLAVLLFGEAALTALWLAGRVTALPTYGVAALAVLGGRLVIAVLQSAAAFSLSQSSPLGARLASRAFLASAILLTLELGARIMPTSVFPSHRWFYVVGYWIYAGTAAVLSEMVRRRTPP